MRHYDDQPDVVRPFVRQAEEEAGQYQQHQQDPDGGAGRRRGGPAQEPGYGGPQEPGYGGPQEQGYDPPHEQGYGAAPAPGYGRAPETSLVPTPMPAPRAVARQIRPGDRAPVPAPRPMSDLTTTMPILAVPAEDGDGYNAPPGEHGHFHDDADNGRHRGGSRSPRALKAAALLVGVVAAGAAVAGTFAGGSDKPSAGPKPAGPATSGAAAEPAPPETPSSSEAGAPVSSSSPSPSATPTPTRSTKSPSPKPTTPASTASTSPAMASRPSSSAPPPTTPPSTPSPPPTPAPPTFTSLHYKDTGPAVSKLQADLIAAGYGYDMAGYRDGTFDRPTRYAVQDFQMNHPGTADADGFGVYGPATDQALQNSMKGATSG
ncbi:peptidoglycan-binding protein [Catenulispora subtropica]|uniref:Peptidoglycan binding-like domain-containing protein n=1 Tax=Catenulispora subtropica TaxID=450798 RepID=A0ABN2SJA7_9ACTN